MVFHVLSEARYSQCPRTSHRSAFHKDWLDKFNLNQLGFRVIHMMIPLHTYEGVDFTLEKMSSFPISACHSERLFSDLSSEAYIIPALRIAAA